ncbi:hypothetical protein ACIQF6_19595 [Kitasatospora sp. NPDC092948]|uniref:hypothetical protein n=1 Tax=Kitasatospora sp. NPDC092948 TaxID=3364088 RepID=UPI003817E050
MTENTPDPTVTDAAFAAIVADLPAVEVAASTEEFGCEFCGGKLEATAPLWFNVYRRADGTPGVDVRGVGIEAFTVSCQFCDQNAGDHLAMLIVDAMAPFDEALKGATA